MGYYGKVKPTELWDAIKSGEVKVGHKITVERLPIYYGSARNAKFTESVKQISGIEITTRENGAERIELQFKGSKIDFTLGSSYALGQEIMTGGWKRGQRRYGLLDF